MNRRAPGETDVLVTGLARGYMTSALQISSRCLQMSDAVLYGSCHTGQGEMAHTAMVHVTHVNENGAGHTCEGAMVHVTHVNEACHTCEGGMSRYA